MVSQAQTVGAPGQLAGTSASRSGRAQKWPLFFSVFGAVAVSLVLWAGIFAAVGWALQLFSN